jgi:hypothetical protein
VSAAERRPLFDLPFELGRRSLEGNTADVFREGDALAVIQSVIVDALFDAVGVLSLWRSLAG